MLVTCSGWLDFGTAERELGTRVAHDLHQLACPTREKITILEAIGDTSLVDGESTAVADQARAFLEHHPQLAQIDWSRPFPLTDADLTPNVFGRIAAEMANLRNDRNRLGVVYTPPILAKDMVALAAATWLEPRTETSIATLLTWLTSERAENTATLVAARKLLSKARWYDSCVGGGVFPVAILNMLMKIGVPPDVALPMITGIDIDPFSIAATRIRVGASADVARSERRHLKSVLEKAFRAGDALAVYTEAPSLSSSSSTDGNCEQDIVIGNPPYVRAERLSLAQKARFKIDYPSFGGSAVDLYQYFIMNALNALGARGALCYVSSASFQRSKSGRYARSAIAEHGAVRAVFDFNELPVFDGASVHSTVYTILKGVEQGFAKVHLFDKLPVASPLMEGLQAAQSVPAACISTSGWQLSGAETANLLENLTRNSDPLVNAVGGIYSGIKTGAKNAFVVSGSDAERLLNDPSSKPFLRPMLRPVDIKRWKSGWSGSYLIVIKKGQLVAYDSELMRHLVRYEAELKSRTDTGGHSTWYGLRECSYYDAFNSPKIIFPDIAAAPRFSLDLDGFLIPDGAFFMSSNDPAILGLLNSSVADFYFKATCNTIGTANRGGRLRFKKAYVGSFPIPRRTPKNRSVMEKIARLAQESHAALSGGDNSELDELAMEIFRLSPQARGLLRGRSY